MARYVRERGNREVACAVRPPSSMSSSMSRSVTLSSCPPALLSVKPPETRPITRQENLTNLEHQPAGDGQRWSEIVCDGLQLPAATAPVSCWFGISLGVALADSAFLQVLRSAGREIAICQQHLLAGDPAATRGCHHGSPHGFCLHGCVCLGLYLNMGLSMEVGYVRGQKETPKDGPVSVIKAAIARWHYTRILCGASQLCLFYFFYSCALVSKPPFPVLPVFFVRTTIPEGVSSRCLTGGMLHIRVATSAVQASDKIPDFAGD